MKINLHAYDPVKLKASLVYYIYLLYYTNLH